MIPVNYQDILNAPLPPPLNLPEDPPIIEYLYNPKKDRIDKTSKVAPQKLRDQLREVTTLPKSTFRVLTKKECAKLDSENEGWVFMPPKLNTQQQTIAAEQTVAEKSHSVIGGEVLGKTRQQYGIKIANLGKPKRSTKAPKNIKIYSTSMPAQNNQATHVDLKQASKNKRIFTIAEVEKKLKYSKPGTYILLKDPEEYQSTQFIDGEKKTTTSQYYTVFYKYMQGKKVRYREINILKNKDERIYSASWGNQAAKKMSSLAEVLKYYTDQKILTKPYRRRIKLPHYYKTLSFQKAKALLHDAEVGQYVKLVEVKENSVCVTLYYKIDGDNKTGIYSIEEKFSGIGKLSKEDRRPLVKRFLKVAIKKGKEERELSTPLKSALERVVTPEAIEKFITVTKKIKQLYGGTLQGACPMNKYYRGEALDERHRYGASLKPFIDIWERCRTTDSFDVWTDKILRDEDKNVPGYRMARRLPRDLLTKVIYMNSKERKKFELGVHEGRLYTEKHGYLKDSDDKICYIYVVSPENKLYVGIYQRGKMNHSSFLSGGAVKAAGELLIKDGVLIGITDKSGHYQPTPEMVVEGLKALKAYGANLRDVAIYFNSTSKADHYEVEDAAEHLEQAIASKKWDAFVKHPKNHGLMSKRTAEEYLQQLPTGAAVLRYSQGQQDYVISKRTGSKQIDHVPKLQLSLDAFQKAAGGFLVHPALFTTTNNT